MTVYIYKYTRILAKGLNYNTKDAAKLDYVADLESALKNTELPDETKERIRHQITTNLHDKRPVKLNNDEQKAININVAHKPTHKLRSYFTKHKDKTTTTETKNAIYMIPCRDCPQRYIGQTSKKIESRITEHKNAIK